MSRTTAQVSFLDEIIVDSFAGGGGASTGIELATGRPVTIAINHDPDAILMHKTNHPYTEHYQASVWDVDPREVCQGRPVGLLWASPDCKHFSKAKGGKPVDKNIRGLAWIVLRWAGTVAPRVIMLENVEEFQTWGPVRKGRPVKSKAGQTFRRWLSQLEALGYAVEWRELVAADYGAPTTRKRFFLIARRDGERPTGGHRGGGGLRVAGYDRQPERAARRGHRRDPAFRAARDPDCRREKRAHEHGGDRTGPEQEVRRSHEREKEPAAGHSPGDGADRLQPGQAGRHVRISGAGPRRG